MSSARDVVFSLGTVLAGRDDLAFALRDRAKRYNTIDLRHHRRFSRATGFKKLDDTRQTAYDGLRLGSFARDLRDDIARLDRLRVRHLKVCTDRHLIRLQRL